MSPRVRVPQPDARSTYQFHSRLRDGEVEVELRRYDEGGLFYGTTARADTFGVALVKLAYNWLDAEQKGMEVPDGVPIPDAFEVVRP